MADEWSASILVIEDEPKYRRLIATNLVMAGYQAREVGDGYLALQELYQNEPDLILLDLRLPDMDGFTLCQRLRKLTTVPILVLTALDTEEALVQSLDLGADDYITKPFSASELTARIRALLRRSQPALTSNGTMPCGRVRLDAKTREMSSGDKTVRLTPTEWRLMREFVLHCGKVLPHEHLLGKVWGPGYQAEHEYLRVYVRRLRQHLEPDPHHPVYLVSHAGIGYALYPDPRGELGGRG
ncbi:MAG: response regulator transcription factor [Thermaerobacter sp.]|nr:response regulator transcription factor [Thermaerobacter sp.]